MYRNILVAVDDSEKSKLALNSAIPVSYTHLLLIICVYYFFLYLNKGKVFILRHKKKYPESSKDVINAVPP